MDSATVSQSVTIQDDFSFDTNSTCLVKPVYKNSTQEFVGKESEYPMTTIEAQNYYQDVDRQSMTWHQLGFSCSNEAFSTTGDSNTNSMLMENQDSLNPKQFSEGLRSEEAVAHQQFDGSFGRNNLSVDHSLAESYCLNNADKLSDEANIDQSTRSYGEMMANANLEASMLNYVEPPFHNGGYESWRSIDSPQDIPPHMNFNPGSIEESLSSTSIKNQALSKELADINCMDFKEINIELDVNNQHQAQDLTDSNHVSFYEVSKLLQNNPDMTNNYFDNSWLQSGNFHAYGNGQPSLYNLISGMYLDSDRYGFVNQQSGSDNNIISPDLTSPIYEGHNDQLMQQMPLYSNCDNLNGHVDFHNCAGDAKAMNRDSYQMQHLRMMDEASYVKTDYQQETFQATSFLSSLCYKDDKELEQNDLKVYHSLETSKHGRISSQTSDSSVDTSGLSNDKNNMISNACDENQYSENYFPANCDKSIYNVVYDYAPEYYYKDFLGESHNEIKNRSRGRGIKRPRQRIGRVAGRSNSRTDQISYDYVLHKDSISYAMHGNHHQHVHREGGDVTKLEWDSKRNDITTGDKFSYISKIKLPNKQKNNQLVFDTSKRPSNVNEAICKYMDYLILENECKTCISSCSTGVQLPYVGFEKERYFHEVMCQPISFPTAKFRDWLKLFDMDIEITDVDGLTASQTTFLPPLSQNNFISPVIGLNESKISLNGAAGKPKDDLIIHSSRRSEIAIRSRGRPRKSWSSFSRYSDKDKSVCFDNAQFVNEGNMAFATQASNKNPYWMTISKDHWQNKSESSETSALAQYNLNDGVSNVCLSKLVQPSIQLTSQNSTLPITDSKASNLPLLKPFSNSIHVLKKGKTDNIVIKVITPPKFQYKLNYEKINGTKASSQPDNKNDNIDKNADQCEPSLVNHENMNEVTKEEKTYRTYALVSNNPEWSEENELISDQNASDNPNENESEVKKKLSTSSLINPIETTEIQESISQCLDVGSNLEVRAEEFDSSGFAAQRKRQRSRSPLSTYLTQPLKKSKVINCKSQESVDTT